MRIMEKFKIRPEPNRGHFSGSGRRGEFNGGNEKARNSRSGGKFGMQKIDMTGTCLPEVRSGSRDTVGPLFRSADPAVSAKRHDIVSVAPVFDQNNCYNRHNFRKRISFELQSSRDRKS